LFNSIVGFILENRKQAKNPLGGLVGLLHFGCDAIKYARGEEERQTFDLLLSGNSLVAI